MNTYLQTLAVIGGILTPIALLLLIRLGIVLSQERQQRVEYRMKQLEKEPPFDDEAEFYEVPNDRMIGISLKKDGAVVWKGAVWKEKVERR